MLTLTIWTWKPENRERLQEMSVEVRERQKIMSPEEKEQFTEIQTLGEWHDVSGNRMFTLQDVNDPLALKIANQDRLKYAKAEYINVIDSNLSIGYFSNHVPSLTNIMPKISYKINIL